MRYLHSVKAHERFVGRGTYQHGETRLLEHWTIHEQPDGAWFMRVDRDGRYADGRSVLLEVWRSPAGALERFDAVAYGAKEDTVRTARVTATVEGAVLHVGRTLNEGERQENEIALPDAYALLPGSTLFYGWALPQVGNGAALVTLGGFDAAFRVALERPAATVAGEETVTVDGKPLPVRQYVMDGDRFWVDGHGVCVRWARGGEVVQLARYTMRG